VQRSSVIEQADVKNVYLNAPLKPDEVIYMKLPPLYSTYRKLPPEFEGKPGIIFKPHKALHGTKQGAHHWYDKLKWVFQKHGFVTLQADKAVFYKFSGEDYTIVAAATDNFRIIGDSVQSTSLVKKQLADHFEIIDLGPINWLLGVGLTCNHDASTIALGQQAYIEQIITHFSLEDSRPAATPMEPGIDLTPGSNTVSPNLLMPSGKTKYREMIGCLMYASMMT